MLAIPAKSPRVIGLHHGETALAISAGQKLQDIQPRRWRLFLVQLVGTLCGVLVLRTRTTQPRRPCEHVVHCKYLLKKWHLRTANGEVKGQSDGGPVRLRFRRANASTLEASPRIVVEVADLLRVLGNVNAVPADLTSMMMRRLIWLIVLSFSFAFIVTAAAGPVVAVVACAGVLIYALAKVRGDAARRAAAAEAEAAAAAAEAKAAAAEAVIAEAEAVIAAARLRLLGGAGS